MENCQVAEEEEKRRLIFTSPNLINVLNSPTENVQINRINFLGFISKGAIDIEAWHEFSPDVGNTASNPHMQRHPTIHAYKLSYV